jgi:hypothetical protein
MPPSSSEVLEGTAKGPLSTSFVVKVTREDESKAKGVVLAKKCEIEK